MGDRKHGEKDSKTKAIQPKREEEQLPESQPHEALSRLSANVAKPGEVLALQRTVGNRAVQHLLSGVQPGTVAPGSIQRHMSDAAFSTWMEGSATVKGAVEDAVQGTQAIQNGVKDVKKGGNNFITAYNLMSRMGRSARDEPCGAEATDGGGE